MSKGDLMQVKDAAKRAGISNRTLDTMAMRGYVKKYMINGYSFVHYRDLLRGAWEFEQAKRYHGIIHESARAAK